MFILLEMNIFDKLETKLMKQKGISYVLECKKGKKKL